MIRFAEMLGEEIDGVFGFDPPSKYYLKMLEQQWLQLAQRQEVIR